MLQKNTRLYIIIAALIVIVIAVVAIVRLTPRDSRADAPAASAAPAAAAQGGADTRSSIVARGGATVSVKPDMATLSVGVTSQERTAKMAQSNVNEVAQAMIEAARASGLADEDILTSGITLYPTYDYSNNTSTINGYEARYTLTLKVYEMEKVGDILDSQIAAGANANGSVSFGLEDDSEAYQEALKQAVADARANAETLSAAGGGRLGGVITITEESRSSYEVYRNYDGAAMAQASMAAMGSTPIMAEAVNLSASVTVIYELR